MNPVVETFGELFDVLKGAREAERKESLERLKAQGLRQPSAVSTPFGLFSQEMFDQALGFVNYVPFGIKKTAFTAVDTIAYDVNNPATWSNFLPPEFLEAELPKSPKHKPRRVKGNKKV